MAVTRILLVEDDEDDYVITRDYLEELSFLDLELIRVVEAEDAIARLTHESFDLCLLDYQLGAVNGLDVLRKTKNSLFFTPIIMLTGQANEELDQAALDAGATDYLVKSELNSNRFARALRYALARSEVEAERVERLKAEEDNRTKTLFLAHLSHELRTPLTSILGYTELLLSKEALQNSRQELDVILRNGRHLLNLLNDVLDLSKIAAGKLEINKTKVNLDNTLADIFTLHSAQAVDKGLQLSFNSLTPLPVFIHTDVTRFRQILINLISNAIKFTDEGSVEVNLFMTQEAEDEFLCVDVKDTGVGIPEDKLTSIFQPFTQVADVVSKSIGGSGLGLAISSELAIRLGGDIRVSSESGVGSCFSFRVQPGDLTGVEREKLSLESSDAYLYNMPEKKVSGRVLVVDDLRDIRTLIGHLVSRSGATVTFASNGHSALSAIDQSIKENNPFDLIFMDIHMPEMNGEEAVVILREQKQYRQPIVALTAASMQGSMERFQKIGFDGMLTKPVDTEKLMQTLFKHLPIKEAESHNEITNSEAGRGDDKDVFPRVLIVEDDKDAANAISLLLENLSTAPEIVNTGRDALRKIDAITWDVVLLDLNLPDTNGMEILKAVRHGKTKASPHTKIAIISGEEISNEIKSTMDIDFVLMKPIQLLALKSLVDDIR